MLATTAAALPAIPVVVDNPLGPWNIQQVGVDDDGTPIWNVSFDIHANAELDGQAACYDVPDGAFVCGEYAFRFFREASAGGANVVEFTGEHGVQIDNLDDHEESQAFCEEQGTPACLGAVDPLFGGFAANLCGGPNGDDEAGDNWVEIAAPAGTDLYVGAIYETPENFDGDPPDSEADPCAPDDDQTAFPGQYSGLSFSETINLG